MKETIALNALIKAKGDVSLAKASVTVRISSRTWHKVMEKFWEIERRSAHTARMTVFHAEENQK